MCKKMNSTELMRYILGGYFIVVGLISIVNINFFTGSLFMISGVALFPIIYKKFNFKYKKYIQIIIPGAFHTAAIISALVSSMITMSSRVNLTSKPMPEPEITAIEELLEEDEVKNEIKSLHLSESEAEMEADNSKEIILEVDSENFEVEDLELCSSNEEIAFLEISENQSENGKLKLQLKGESEGECEVFVKAINGIESNRISVHVTDAQKYEEENAHEDTQHSTSEDNAQDEEVQDKEPIYQTKKEESFKQETSKTSPKTSPKTNTKNDTGTNKTTSSKNSKSNTNNTHGEKIYCTPKGKRYHFDPNCGGKNSRETTLDAALAKGLTPCKKCAK